MAKAISKPISLVALGTALTATLVVLYALCAIAAVLFPKAPLAHSWLLLFSTAPVGSLESLVTGIVANVAFAWISAAVFAPVYHRLTSSP